MSETAVQLHKAEPPAVVLTREDVRRYICPNADDKEIFMFLGICKSFGLNPLKREVHLIKYGSSPASIVTGYEVYLKRAERTGKLNGWKVEVSKDGTQATVTIHRKDWNQPFEWTAFRQEFDKGQANWKTMPLFMLRKVAIAQAFRICFPDEMGGLPYLPEEISGQVSESLPSQTVDTAPETAANPPQGLPTAAAPGVETPPASPPSTDEDKRRELRELANLACDLGWYPEPGAAIYAWSRWVKEGKEYGYKDEARVKFIGKALKTALDEFKKRETETKKVAEPKAQEDDQDILF